MEPLYVIDIEAEACRIEVDVNGFPVMRRNFKYYSNNVAHLNPFLIGSPNVVKIAAIPSDADPANVAEYGNAIKKIKLSGKVKQYFPGDISAPEAGHVIHSFNLDQKVAGSFTFDNQNLNFSRVLKDAHKIHDTDIVKEYAVKLYHMSANNDVKAMEEEFHPKMRDYAIAAHQNDLSFMQDFTTFLSNDFFQFPPGKKAISPAELYTLSHCDGRIIEVGRLPAEPLLVRDANDEDEFHMFVFVGLVDHKLKVVR